MDNDKAWGRYAKLQVMIGKMCLEGSRRLEDFIEVQQNFVSNPRWSTGKTVNSSQKFKLYLAPGQQSGGRMKGFDLEKHLGETGLISRCFSLEDDWHDRNPALLACS